MSKRSDFERRKNDAYMTPKGAITPLLKHLPRGSTFIEPAAGAGAIVDVLEEAGHTCVDRFDIDPQRDDVKEFDAFDYPIYNYNQAGFIITNPPWTRTKASGYLMHRMIDLWAGIRPTWLLFDADWAHTKQASPYLDYCTKIVAIGRVKWIEDSKYSGKDNVCWYHFDKSQNGQSTIFIGRE